LAGAANDNDARRRALSRVECLNESDGEAEVERVARLGAVEGQGEAGAVARYEQAVGHVPLQSGARFSTNARAPSPASFEVKTRSNSSRTMVHASGLHVDSNAANDMRRLLDCTDSGAFAAII